MAKSHGVIACASITQFDKHIVKLEEKLELSKVHLLIVQSLIEKVQALDDTSKEHHVVIADQAEGEAVASEPVVLDEHEDKIFSYTSSLRQLLKRSEPTAAPAFMKDPCSICTDECAKWIGNL